MHDPTYIEALAAAPAPRVVLLGPVECHSCGAWVEWAGVSWLALDSDEAHDCAPFLVAGQRLYPTVDQAHPMAWGEHPDSAQRDVLLIAGAIAGLVLLAWCAQWLRQAQGG